MAWVKEEREIRTIEGEAAVELEGTEEGLGIHDYSTQGADRVALAVRVVGSTTGIKSGGGGFF